MENTKRFYGDNASTHRTTWRCHGTRWFNHALDVLTQVDTQTALNDLPIVRANTSIGIDTELRAVMNRLRGAAYDPEHHRFDYARAASNDLYPQLREMAAQLVHFDPAALSTEEQRLAFWINLYNVLIMHGVIAFGIRKSVWEDWGFFRRAAYIVGGKRISADQIENGILRRNRRAPYMPFPVFALDDPRACWMLSHVDPRIHAALHCASRSCPPIAEYEPEKIHAQLDLAARAFVNGATALDWQKEIIFLSPIFKWYAEDFGGREGIWEFVTGYWANEVQAGELWQARARFRIIWTKYDWGLDH